MRQKSKSTYGAGHLGIRGNRNPRAVTRGLLLALLSPPAFPVCQARQISPNTAGPLLQSTCSSGRTKSSNGACRLLVKPHPQHFNRLRRQGRRHQRSGAGEPRDYAKALMKWLNDAQVRTLLVILESMAWPTERVTPVEIKEGDSQRRPCTFHKVRLSWET